MGVAVIVVAGDLQPATPNAISAKATETETHRSVFARDGCLFAAISIRDGPKPSTSTRITIVRSLAKANGPRAKRPVEKGPTGIAPETGFTIGAVVVNVAANGTGTPCV